MFAIEGFEATDLLTIGGFGPKPFAFALGIVGNHRAGGFENVLGGPVILFEPDHFGIREVALEIEDVADVGAAPAIDGLILVTHHADVLVGLGEQAHQVVLAAIGVLVFVDHDEFETAIHLEAQIGVVGEQPHGFEQQVVEIERVGLAQAAFVLFVDGGELRGLLVGGGAVDVGGRFLAAFLMADPGAHGAILHELFVQAHLLVNRLDHGHLIVVVVDGELARESVADFGQARPVAPQQPHAKGVEGGDQRAVLAARAAQKVVHPRAHFLGCLIRKGHGQYASTGDAMLVHEVRHAVGDHACLAAARSGQQ